MSEHLDLIPVEIQSHIRQITKTSGLPDTDMSVDMIAQGWLEKKERFEKLLARMSLEEVDLLEKTDPRGCLAMTYSGSLHQHRAPCAREGEPSSTRASGCGRTFRRSPLKNGSELAAEVVEGATGHLHAGTHQELVPRFQDRRRPRRTWTSRSRSGRSRRRHRSSRSSSWRSTRIWRRRKRLA